MIMLIFYSTRSSLPSFWFLLPSTMVSFFLFLIFSILLMTTYRLIIPMIGPSYNNGNDESWQYQRHHVANAANNDSGWTQQGERGTRAWAKLQQRPRRLPSPYRSPHHHRQCIEGPQRTDIRTGTRDASASWVLGAFFLFFVFFFLLIIITISQPVQEHTIGPSCNIGHDVNHNHNDHNSYQNDQW